MIEEKVRKFIALRTSQKHLPDLAKNFIRQYLGGLSSMLAGLIPQEEVERAAQEISCGMEKRGLEQEIIERMIPLWCEHFSEEEMDALITFYESPIGQKTLVTEMQIKEKETQITISVAKKFVADFIEEKKKEEEL